MWFLSLGHKRSLSCCLLSLWTQPACWEETRATWDTTHRYPHPWLRSQWLAGTRKEADFDMALAPATVLLQWNENLARDPSENPVSFHNCEAKIISLYNKIKPQCFGDDLSHCNRKQECNLYTLYIYNLPQSTTTWELNSQTRNWTQAAAVKVPTPNR